MTYALAASSESAPNLSFDNKHQCNYLNGYDRIRFGRDKKRCLFLSKTMQTTKRQNNCTVKMQIQFKGNNLGCSSVISEEGYPGISKGGSWVQRTNSGPQQQDVGQAQTGNSIF